MAKTPKPEDATGEPDEAMTGAERPDVLRQTDDDARRLARILLRSARFTAIAVLEPDSGHPLASRVLTATDVDGVPVILVSALSAHTKALARDPRASLLAGEPGKGDPLAHPRLSVQCIGETVDRGDPAHARVRRRFIARHPKAALYADFGDFSFIRLTPVSANLNGGFGRAYALDGADLIIRSPAIGALGDIEAGAIEHMNTDHSDAATRYATILAGRKDGVWHVCGIDAAGIDLASNDRLARVEFDAAIEKAADLRLVLSSLLDRTH